MKIKLFEISVNLRVDNERIASQTNKSNYCTDLKVYNFKPNLGLFNLTLEVILPY